MLSAIGKLHTSLTSRPSRSVIHTRLGKRPQGTAYENGRWSASMMTKFPSGEGSSRVCIAGPEPNGVTSPVNTLTLTKSEELKYSNRSPSCESFSRSAYVRA